ncbi:hypothetical protein H1R17_12745 [Flavobacterium sp. xlx-214]|uniref:hypothetical protein n=1 Tax=unclassified Flavobacterium TaxID=196869 RepID=UPI0013D03892|nr:MULTISPECIES: hypothetical protein [unclassified Flavobacterium]MBA5791541.1 hypothetical protein [Flavobacterium sp. xlx-221]QMI83309.1 hypothetical protein H1R17_12745 [Flavobacterium sp. xlx-214]
MNQIEFKENKLLSRAKKSPLLGRMLLYLITILSIVSPLSGCSSLSKINGETTNVEVKLGNIDDFVKYEKSVNSEDITRNYFVDVSEGIYPFIKNHKFEIPKEYKSNPQQNIVLTKCYYYNSQGEVKLIYYQWNEKNNYEKSNEVFEKIFYEVRSNITKQIGSPSEINLESKTINDDSTFRDDIKWNSSHNVYMFRFGDNENRHNEINLVIYKD